MACLGCQVVMHRFWRTLGEKLKNAQKSIKFPAFMVFPQVALRLFLLIMCMKEIKKRRAMKLKSGKINLGVYWLCVKDKNILFKKSLARPDPALYS